MKWEHKFLALHLADRQNEDYLNRLGATGWEVVAIIPNVTGDWTVHTALLKRPFLEENSN